MQIQIYNNLVNPYYNQSNVYLPYDYINQQRQDAYNDIFDDSVTFHDWSQAATQRQNPSQSQSYIQPTRNTHNNTSQVNDPVLNDFTTTL